MCVPLCEKRGCCCCCCFSSPKSPQLSRCGPAPRVSPPRTTGQATTYEQRYFVCDRWWDKARHGPVFFYFGNEDNVELYVNHTGLMWESAAEFGALLLFMEHRSGPARAGRTPQPPAPGTPAPPLSPPLLQVLRRLQALSARHRRLHELAHHRAGHGRLCDAAARLQEGQKGGGRAHHWLWRLVRRHGAATQLAMRALFALCWALRAVPHQCPLMAPMPAPAFPPRHSCLHHTSGPQIALWFRRKYPQLVDGVISASAPIWSFANMEPAYDYAGGAAQAVASDASSWRRASLDCS